MASSSLHQNGLSQYWPRAVAEGETSGVKTNMGCSGMCVCGRGGVVLNWGLLLMASMEDMLPQVGEEAC